MKKKIFMLALMSIFALASCEDKLSDEFINPDTYKPTEDQTIYGLFTDMEFQWKIFVMDYGDWYYLLGNGTNITGYSQLAQRYITPRYSWFSTYDDLTQGNGFSPEQIGNLFNETYVKLKGLPIMKKNLATLSGTSAADNRIYVTLAEVIKGFAIARIVDLYNSVPYTEALNGINGVFTPAYDDPKQTYESIIGELKTLSDSIPTQFNGMSAEAKATFAKQDLIFAGDPVKWVQYTNALRLKLAVRISGVDETFAKQHIQDVLSKPLPTSDLTWKINDAQSPTGGGTWIRGMYETTYATFIPNVIMKRMNYGTLAYEGGTDDPRLPVLAMPTKYNDYRGVTYDADAAAAGYAAGDKYYPYADDLPSSLAQNSKSMYNHGTFHRNEYFPVYMFSRAELDLLLAEVALKGYGSTGSTAGDHIANAVVHSTDFWYNINSLSQYETGNVAVHPARPSASVVNTYANTVKDRFNAAANLEDKMEILMQQKYIHLNMMGYHELFAELRRTRHPKLEPMTFGGKVMKPMVERLKYPNTELATNEQNYLKVVGQDNYTTPVFWVPDSKKNESYYRNDYNY